MQVLAYFSAEVKANHRWRCSALRMVFHLTTFKRVCEKKRIWHIEWLRR